MTALATTPPATTPAAWSVTQEGDTAWQVWAGTEPQGSVHPTYQAAVAQLAADLAAGTEAPAADGLLPEAWHSPNGIAFSQPTGDGRDFSQTAWTWRDPAVSVLPLMLQTKTDMGHFGAELAGQITEVSEAGGTVYATGRFYDSALGVQARDLLLGDRRFGVSVDPGAVVASWECLEEDEDGWCTAERINFEAYEVIGLTMTPFPAFAEASIELAAAAQLAVAPADHAFTDGNGDGNCDACLAENDQGECTQVCDLTEAEHTAPASEASTVVTAASALLLTHPPRAWFEVPEPAQDDLIDQGDGTWALPLSITEEGQVYGHVARWGQCHTGYPGACVTPPHSASGYRGFHLGAVHTAEGDDLATGTLVVAADHAPTYLRAAGAHDHYAHTGLAWADVRAVDGDWGPWVCGALRPDVTPELLRVLRASTLSGDWRGGELVAVLSVNTPGFPIAREALVASGLPMDQLPDLRPQAVLRNGQADVLLASGQVRRCPDCGRRRASLSAERSPAAQLADQVAQRVLAGLRAELGDLALVERRTRHLRGAQAAALRQRLGR